MNKTIQIGKVWITDDVKIQSHGHLPFHRKLPRRYGILEGENLKNLNRCGD